MKDVVGGNAEERGTEYQGKQVDFAEDEENGVCRRQKTQTQRYDHPDRRRQGSVEKKNEQSDAEGGESPDDGRFFLSGRGGGFAQQKGAGSLKNGRRHC